MSHECRKCGLDLHPAYNWCASSERKRNYICDTCRKVYQKKYYSDNKEVMSARNRERYQKNSAKYLAKQKERYIQNTFGITQEEYDHYLSNPCSICGSEGDLVLDHCHSTGKIRGPLCRQCNAALGLFKDSANLLEKAKEYLNGDC